LCAGFSLHGCVLLLLGVRRGEGRERRGEGREERGGEKGGANRERTRTPLSSQKSLQIIFKLRRRRETVQAHVHHLPAFFFALLGCILAELFYYLGINFVTESRNLYS
jgi:hypothetical protein